MGGSDGYSESDDVVEASSRIKLNRSFISEDVNVSKDENGEDGKMPTSKAD